jgi:SAM-dependent methyltransferase
MNILSLFISKNPKKYWLNLLLILGIVLIVIYFYKKQNLAAFYEGFTQDNKFVSKFDADKYDDFYVKIYDSIMLPNKRSDYEVQKIIEMTDPNKKSVFLEIGSGTGDLVYSLKSKGYKVFGIDKSKSMVAQSETKYPDLQVTLGDATNPMTYESNTFSHILCMGLTIYEFENKREFFNNCYFWLKSGGYLVIHLVDRDKFDTIIPGGKPPILSNPQAYSEKRIKDTIIDFIDFEYKSSYNIDDSTSDVVLKETFTDGLTKNIRQNEFTLHMENTKDILAVAMSSGFLVKGYDSLSEMGDSNQYIYVLEKKD